MNTKKVIFFVEGLDAKALDDTYIDRDPRIDPKLLEGMHQQSQAYLREVAFDKLSVPLQGREEVSLWVRKMVINLCIADFLKRRPDFDVSGVVGYSIGLITGMVITEAIAIETAVDLICLSYRLGAEENGNFATVFEWGVPVGQVCAWIEEKNYDDRLYLASDMGEWIGLFSGQREAAEELVHMLLDEGVVSQSFIEVPIAFHTRFAVERVPIAERFVKDLPVQPPAIPLYSMYTGQILTEAQALREEIPKNMCSRIPLRTFLESFQEQDVYFVEPSLRNGFSKICQSINKRISFIRTK